MGLAEAVADGERVGTGVAEREALSVGDQEWLGVWEGLPVGLGRGVKVEVWEGLPVGDQLRETVCGWVLDADWGPEFDGPGKK